MASKYQTVKMDYEYIERSKSYRNQFYVAMLLNLGTMSFGSVIGWVSPSMPFLKSSATPLDKPFTEEQVSWIGSIPFISALLGTVLFGYLSNICGRKLTACLITLPLMIHWIFIIVAKSINFIIIARVFAGIGGGGILFLTPVYIAEIAEVKVRGLLASFLSMSINSGCLLIYIVGSFVPYRTVPYIMISIPILSFLIILFFLRETPAYLMRRGNELKATNTLLWLRGVSTGCNVNDEDIKEEITKLKEFSQQEGPSVSYKDFMTKASIRGLMTGIIILAIQQSSGVFAIFSYASIIFAEAGSSIPPNFAAITVGALQLLGACLSSTLIERTGRRALLISSSLCVSTCLITLATYLLLREYKHDVSAFGWIPVIALSVCVFSYSCGLGPVPLVLVSELFAPKTRRIATTICVFLFWTFSFLIVRFFKILSSLLYDFGCFYLLGGIMIFGAMFTYFLVPETKGRTLDNILKELSDGWLVKHKSSK